MFDDQQVKSSAPAVAGAGKEEGAPVTPRPLPPAMAAGEDGPRPARTAVMIIVGLIAAAGLGYGGYYLYNKIAAPPGEPAGDLPATADQRVETDDSIAPEQNIDTDRDGLFDKDEIELGTDINNPDTDNDLLSDFDEVKIYFTDPLKADTDADGYNDGEEVRNGYNPKGEGRLLNFEAEKQKADTRG